jgi:hypothetical protein
MKAIDGATEYNVQKAYQLPRMEAELDADFLYSDNLETIETGARTFARSAELLALVTGMAIIRIERDGLWMQAGFDNLRAYRIAQKERLGLPKQTISTYRKIAESWLENRKLLARVPLEGHISKLSYFSAALAYHQDSKLVVDHFKRDSFDEFRSFARPDLARPELPAVDYDLTDSGILIDGLPVLLWSDALPDPDRKWLGNILEKSYQARAGGNLAHVVAVYDDGEARAVDNFLKKLRASK